MNCGKCLLSLISQDELQVDSIIVASLMALLFYFGLYVYATIMAPASWNGFYFASGAATLIGAMGASKRWRDGVSNSDPSKPNG